MFRKGLPTATPILLPSVDNLLVRELRRANGIRTSHWAATIFLCCLDETLLPFALAS